MRSPIYFIAKPYGGRYANRKNGIITSASIEDHTATNRLAEVVATPLNYEGEVQEGDILVVHHNTFRYFYDIKGRRVSGNSFFKDDKFFIAPDEFYMYRREGQWHSHMDYCFIKPLPVRDGVIMKPGSEEPLVGTVRYGNRYLEEYGIQEGDEIIFEPESECAFDIDDEHLYRMRTKDIVAA